MSRPESAASPNVRVVTVAAVLLVATVAAVVSYAHMQEVADRSGEQWRSWLIPLSVDGLVVAASMVLLTRHRAGQTGGWLPWCALLGAVGASLAANVAAAEATATARVVAAWPAVAFAVAFELLLSQRRPAATQLAGEDDTRVGEPPGEQAEPGVVLPAPVANPAPTRAPTSPTPAPTRAPTSPGGWKTPPPARVGDDDLTRTRELLAQAGGRPPGRRALARHLGVTEHEARRLLAATNGTGGGEPS